CAAALLTAARDPLPHRPARSAADRRRLPGGVARRRARRGGSRPGGDLSPGRRDDQTGTARRPPARLRERRRRHERAGAGTSRGWSTTARRGGRMTDQRTALVAAGYDAMIDTWESWKAQITDDRRREWCEELLARLEPGATVIELGCGGGSDETRVLAERFRLTGVDL